MEICLLIISGRKCEENGEIYFGHIPDYNYVRSWSLVLQCSLEIHLDESYER